MSQPVSGRDRYKDTPTFTEGGVSGLGLFEPPADLDGLPAYGSYVVTDQDVGFPDRVAVNVYGPGNEDLWWAVLWRSGVIDADAQMYAGQVLSYPPVDAARRYVDRAGDVTGATA